MAYMECLGIAYMVRCSWSLDVLVPSLAPMLQSTGLPWAPQQPRFQGDEGCPPSVHPTSNAWVSSGRMKKKANPEQMNIRVSFHCTGS